MQEQIIQGTIDALLSVCQNRFFQNERGYQGKFYCALHAELDKYTFLSEHKILEMEYQKSGIHGTRQRPDIIFHVPSELTRAGVAENNFAVWALKANARSRAAKDDFEKLDRMFDTLHYPLGMFINIRSRTHHMESYTGPHPDRLHCFAVSLSGSDVTVIHGFLSCGFLMEKKYESRVPQES